MAKKIALAKPGTAFMRAGFNIAWPLGAEKSEVAELPSDLKKWPPAVLEAIAAGKLVYSTAKPTAVVPAVGVALKVAYGQQAHDIMAKPPGVVHVGAATAVAAGLPLKEVHPVQLGSMEPFSVPAPDDIDTEEDDDEDETTDEQTDEPESDEGTEPVEPAPAPEDLDSLNKADLVKMADAYGVDSTGTKEDVLAALKAHLEKA